MHRVDRLVGAFEHIARTRMAGVPVLHAGLRTEAIGFAPQSCDEGQPGVLGVLVTPWFMNLLWLPPADAPALAMGASRLRRLGGEVLSFMGAEEAGCRFEACSLFSPMFEFQDQAAARAVAHAVLQELRRPRTGAAGASAPVALVEAAAPLATCATAAPAVQTVKPPPAVGAPTRRGLLFGRRAQDGAR